MYCRKYYEYEIGLEAIMYASFKLYKKSMNFI